MKTIMKTFGLTILLSVFLLSSGFAQDNRDKFLFGPKIGFNIANVYDTEGEQFDADPKLGLAAGVFISIPITPLIGVQPEILFSQKGFKASGSFLGSPYTFTRTLNYLDIPLLLAVKPAPMITILAGPQYSYLISKREVFESSFLTTDQEEQFTNESLRKNTICFIGGLDVNLNRFVFGARAGWDLFKNNGDGTSTTPRYKNVWYQVTIGFAI